MPQIHARRSHRLWKPQIVACLSSISPAISRRGRATLEQACGDGEDFELIFAVPPERAPSLAAGWPFAGTPLTRLGEFTAATGLWDPSGQPLAVTGWDHFVF